MTPSPQPPPNPAAILKNILGALLLIAGVAGLLTAAWLAHPHLGLGATSAACGAAGFWLATSEA